VTKAYSTLTPAYSRVIDLLINTNNYNNNNNNNNSNDDGNATESYATTMK